MPRAEILLENRRPNVVGSFGGLSALSETTREICATSCDLAEIRLDLLPPGSQKNWSHLAGIPLLFTARRREEGGAGDLDAATRSQLLADVLEEAACIDVEVASIAEMSELLEKASARGIPWIASFHDFEKLPATEVLADAVRRAREAGAAVFKAAAKLLSPSDMARLADFQLADHGLPVSTMGMGPLAPVSRLLCAQCGSVLNYGYLGDAPTTPDQWDSATLKAAIAKLAPVLG